MGVVGKGSVFRSKSLVRKYIALLSVLLVAFMVLLLFSAVADDENSEGADSEFSGSVNANINWELKYGNTLCLTGTGDMPDTWTDANNNRPPWETYRRSIMYLDIDPNITSIGRYTFIRYTALTGTLDLSNVATVGEYSFYNCTGFTGIDADNLEIIEERAFCACYGLVSIDLSPERIETYAFYNCSSLAEVELTNVTYIGERAFESCTGLVSVDLINVDTVAYAAFGSCRSLLTVKMMNVVTLEPYAFSSCYSLRSLDFGNALTEMGSYSFCYCYSLYTVIIPSSVKTTSLSNVFYQCTSLREVYDFSDRPQANKVAGLNSYVFKTHLEENEMSILRYTDRYGGYTTKDAADYVFYYDNEEGSYKLAAYLGNSGQTEFKIPEKVQADADGPYAVWDYVLPSYLFSGMSSIRSVSIPSVVTALDDGTFYYCTSLRSVSTYNSDTQKSGLQSITGILPKNTFYGCTNLEMEQLTNAWMPNITSIGDYAFGYCEGIESVDLSNLDQISTYAFTRTGITSVKLENIETIGSWAFYASQSLVSLDMDNIGSIDAHAFYSTALVSVDLSGVETFTGAAFTGCSKLKNVIIRADNEYTDIPGIFVTSSYTQTKLDSIVNWSFDSATGMLTLSRLDGYSAGVVYDMAVDEAPWSDDTVTNIDMNGITKIGTNTFSNVTSDICVPSGIEIDDTAFSNARSLILFTLNDTTLTISNYYRSGSIARGGMLPDFTVVPAWMAGWNDISSVIVSDGITKIGANWFNNTDSSTGKYTSITSVYIPQSVTVIGNNVFSGCSMLNAVMSSRGLTIGTNAFKNADMVLLYELDGAVLTLKVAAGEYRPMMDFDQGAAPWYSSSSQITSVTIRGVADEGVKINSIGSYAFQNCTNLRTVTIQFASGFGLASIGSYAFDGCVALESINCSGTTSGCSVPGTVTTIGNYAFRGCANLASISKNVISVGDYAFYGCDSLVIRGASSILMLETIGDHAFYGCRNLKLVSEGGTSTTLALSDKVSAIGAYAFNGCVSLTQIDMQSNELATIPDGAFSECTGITSVLFSSSVTKIGAYAFEGCTSLDVDIPSTVTIIMEGAFKDSGLENVTIPSCVGSIRANVFQGCKSLASIDLGNVTSIGEYAFQSCSSLNNVSVPNGMSSIGNYAFYGCSSLKNITFGTGLRTISDYAFYGCAAKSIDLPQSLTSIGASSFRDCKQLKSVEIPSAVTSIGGYAFADCYGVKTLILEIPVTVSAGTFGTQCFGFGTSTNPVDVSVKWDGATTTIICLLKTTYATMDQYTNIVDTDFTVTVYYTFEKGALTDAGRSSIVSAGGTYYIPSVDDLDIDSDFKTGKYVESWYEVISGGQMEKITGTEFVVVNDTVICVNYEFNRYTVTFYNSGSISDGTFGSPLSVKEGDTVSEPLIDPVKEGSTFDKWYSNSACTVEYDFCTKIARNVNIYAGWIPDTYTINFQSGDFVDHTNVVIVWSEGHCSLTGSGVTRLITTTTANGQGYTMVLTYEDFVTYYNSRFPLTIGTVSNTNESVRFVSTSGTFFTDNVLTRSSFSNIGDGKYSVVVRTEFYSDYVMVYDMNSTDTLIAGISSFKVSGYSDDDVVVLPTVDEISDKGVGFKGYDFLGWSTTEEGTVLFAGNSNFEPTGGLGSVADANREVRLYAIWSPIEYTVVYTGYGIMTETVNVETGNVSTVIGKTLANEGYMDFKGWSLTNSASGNNIILTSSNVMKDLISSNNNTITLYSVWGDRAYLLKYELNKSGETADMSSYNKYCSVGDVMITPDLSDRYSGVTFLGWSSDSKATVATEYTEFTSQMADSTGTNLTYTLYGVWEYTEYSISFMVDKVGVEAPQVLTKYHLGDPITLPTVKDISGYSFAGWSLDDENANSLLNNVKTFTQEMATSGSTNGNVTLFYASWTENSYTVEYEDRTKVATFDQGFSLDTPVKTGYLFKGWKSDDIDGDTSKKSYDGKNWSPWDGSLVDTIYFKNLTTGTGTVNLVAEWEEITYTVVYNMNGVPLDAPEDETYVLNEDFTVATPGVTENGGQTFVGWATSPDATSRYSFPAKFSSTMVRMTDDEGVVTLYAVWKDTESVTTVSIDLNGGTPSKIPSGWHKADDGTYYTTVEKGVDTSDILNDWNDVSVSKSGYSSAGWDYSDTVVSDDGSTVIVLTYDEVSYSSMFIGFGLVAAIFIVGILFARRER